MRVLYFSMTAKLGTIKFVYVKSFLCQIVDLPGNNCGKNSSVVAFDTSSYATQKLSMTLARAHAETTEFLIGLLSTKLILFLWGSNPTW